MTRTIRCVMALIRGFPGLHCCPRCLIADVELDNFSAEAPLRTIEAADVILKEARKQALLKDKEEILKGSGMRDVDVRP